MEFRFKKGDKVVSVFKPRKGQKRLTGTVGLVEDIDGRERLHLYGYGNAWADNFVLKGEKVMSDFKVGDRVVVSRPDCTSQANGFEGLKGMVSEVIGHTCEVNGLIFFKSELSHAEDDLDQALRLAESRRKVLGEKESEISKEKHYLNKRIDELKRLIKERDKPKGRVKIGDKPIKGHDYWSAAASGAAYRVSHSRASWSGYVSMGTLFYDRESAERHIHDRKIQVKLEQSK